MQRCVDWSVHGNGPVRLRRTKCPNEANRAVSMSDTFHTSAQTAAWAALPAPVPLPRPRPLLIKPILILSVPPHDQIPASIPHHTNMHRRIRIMTSVIPEFLSRLEFSKIQFIDQIHIRCALKPYFHRKMSLAVRIRKFYHITRSHSASLKPTSTVSPLISSGRLTSIPSAARRASCSSSDISGSRSFNCIDL